MNWSRTITQLLSKTAGIACGLLLSSVAYSQADSTKIVPSTFIFSKYQLPTRGDSSATLFFAAPLNPSPYKIHYKIKTLSFPADPNPKPKRFNLVDAIITGYIEGKNKDEHTSSSIVPFKKH